MRLVFAGTPSAAVPSLRVLAGSHHVVTAVVSREDAAVGRRRVLTPSPVAQTAAELDIATIKANRLDAAVTTEIEATRADLGVIVAYGGLVREPLLSVPRLGWINLHFSLLPRWRGAAPVQHAIIAGDETTGASVFQLVAELDAGAVFGARTYEIEADATAGRVLDDLATLGAGLLLEVVDALESGTAQASPQRGAPTLAPKLTLDDGRIRWDESSRAVRDRIRGTTPEPGAHTSIDGARLKVLEAFAHEPAVHQEPGVIRAEHGLIIAGTGDGAIRLGRVQPAGKQDMDAGDWWRGLRTSELRADL